MRKFVQKALQKLPKLDKEQIHDLIQQLASENDLFETVLDSLTTGVVVTDQQHMIVFANKAAERLVRFSVTETTDRLVWEVIADADISGFVRRVLEDQETVADFEFTVDSHSTARVLALSVLPSVSAGRVNGNILLIDDVSQRRWREARLRRAESLASLTTLAAGVAHEIKNPLGSIGIHIQLAQKLLRSSSNQNSEELNRYLNVMNEEVERLNRIVVDFLFAVRPMDTHLEPGSLNDLVDDVMGFMRPELEQENIEIAVDLEPQLPQIMFDQKLLKQAILNIVKNALAAMPDGGRLSVGTLHRGDEVILRLTDNGIGMSDEIVEKIFEPYFTTKEFGSGIGLTLVYKVVKEHAADIAVVSQEGRGSTFSIHFPIPQKEQYLLSWQGADSDGSADETLLLRKGARQ